MKTPAQLAGEKAASEAAPDFGPLHTVWYSVLKPGVVALPDGRPAFEMLHQAQTLAEATAVVKNIPGGAITLNCIVFVNPKASPILRPQ